MGRGGDSGQSPRGVLRAVLSVEHGREGQVSTLVRGGAGSQIRCSGEEQQRV